MRTVTLRLMSTRNCYYTWHLCQVIFNSTGDWPTFTITSTRTNLHLYKVAVLDKHKVSLTFKWLTRVASLHPIAPGRPVMPSEVACFGQCLSETSSGEDTWEKNTTKRALWYVQWLKTLTQVDSILTHPHILSPHWHQRRKSLSDAAEITLKKLASF